MLKAMTAKIVGNCLLSQLRLKHTIVHEQNKRRKQNQVPFRIFFNLMEAGLKTENVCENRIEIRLIFKKLFKEQN